MWFHSDPYRCYLRWVFKRKYSWINTWSRKKFSKLFVGISQWCRHYGRSGFQAVFDRGWAPRDFASISMSENWFTPLFSISPILSLRFASTFIIYVHKSLQLTIDVLSDRAPLQPSIFSSLFKIRSSNPSTYVKISPSSLHWSNEENIEERKLSPRENVTVSIFDWAECWSRVPLTSDWAECWSRVPLTSDWAEC